jgi:hypothetical protein
MRGFGDQHVLLSDKAVGLLEGKFYDPGVGFVFGGEFPRRRRRFYPRKPYGTALRLGDDLVFDDKNVPDIKAKSTEGQGVDDEISDRVASNNFTDSPHGYGTEFGGASKVS